MSILNYFCHNDKAVSTHKKTSIDLPDPEGTLSKEIPPPAIERANARVSKVVEKQ